jgi:hypothetical protein
MTTVGIGDEAIAFLVECRHRTAAEFGVQLADEPVPRLEWGERPEFRAAVDGEPARIILSRHDPDWWRVRYQIAHEVFHWLCTPPGTFHWTHELFAVETAIRAMDEIGEHEYAARTRERLTREAELLPLVAMLTVTFRETYPDGLYGRAWLTGSQLQAAVGWDRLKPLARCFDEQDRPDVVAWLGSLTSGAQASAASVLGLPAPEWV